MVVIFWGQALRSFANCSMATTFRSKADSNALTGSVFFQDPPSQYPMVGESAVLASLSLMPPYCQKKQHAVHHNIIKSAKLSQ